MTTRRIGPRLLTLGSGALLTLWATGAFASGFALIEQSVSGLGNAFAGGSAAAEDATTIFYNPAGLTRLKGQQAIVGAHIIMPHAEYSNDTARNALGQPITGGDGGDAGVTGIAPNGYYTVGLSNGLAFGLGVTAPFGLATEYPDDWVGRYHAVKSAVKSVDLNPSVAYRVSKNWSLGAGVSAQWLDAELTSMVDVGLIGALYGVPGAAPSTPALDARAELTGDSWAYGFNLGTLYEFSENTRLGVSYRSRMRHKVDGRAEFAVPAASAPIAAAAGLTDVDAEVSITLPDSASLSLYHRINPQWALMADVSWTNWSTFDELRVEYDDGRDDTTTTENWEDTFRFSVGATYRPVPAWTLRAGVAYDQEPIPDAEHRTPRIPGNDRTWVALGLGYQIASWFGVDVGYAHLFVEDPKIDKQAGTDPQGEDFLRGTLVGSYDASVDIVSAQLRAAF